MSSPMLAAGIRKEFQLLIRDRGTLISMFILPLVFIAVFGSIFKFGPGTGKPRPVAVSSPSDARSLQLVAALKTSLDNGKAFSVVEKATADQARAAVAEEEVVAAIILSELPKANGVDPLLPGIELSLDENSPASVRGPIQGALQAAIFQALLTTHPDFSPRLAQTLATPIVIATPSQLRKPPANMSGFQVSTPGNAVLFSFFISLTVAMSFSEEKRSGTWRRQLAAPVSRLSIVVAKLVPFFVIAILQMVFLFGVAFVAFGLKISGSLSAFAATIVAVSACATSLGLLFASFGGSEKQLGSIGSVVNLVMGLIGGCMVPRLVMPDFFRSIGSFVPQSWSLDGYYKLLLYSDTGFSDVARELIALGCFTLVFIIVGAKRFKFE